MGQGRPTVYKPEYDDLIVQRANEGACFAEFAAEIGVSRQTLHNWKKAHPSFLDAYTRAEQVGEAHWAKRLRTELMIDNKANAPLVKLYFANRFGWSDKIVNENTGPDGGPQQHVVKHQLSDEAVATLKELTDALR
jgi:transposase-like protein